MTTASRITALSMLLSAASWPKLCHSSHPVVGSGQETGMVMVGQLIHGHLQRRRMKTVSYDGSWRPRKVLLISQQIIPVLIAVLLHTGQKPGQRLHKCIIVHHRIPLISLEPGARHLRNALPESMASGLASLTVFRNSFQNS